MPVTLDEFMASKKPVPLDEFMRPPSRWSTPRTLGGKAVKAITKPIGKGLWTGLGILAKPYERAQAMGAGPATAIQETGWPLNPMAALSGAIGFDKDKMGPIEGIKHIAKSFVPPLKGLYRWGDMPEGTKMWSDVFRAYQKKMVGPGVESYPSLPSVFDWDFQVSPEASATAAGVGTSFMTDPLVVSKAFKGLTRLGKATPWYKSYAASRLPALESLMLEHGADKAAGIEKARQLGKTVSTKAIKPIAAKLFGVAKPSKSQIAATAKRLKQIEQGGVTTSPELAEKAGGFADFWAKNRPVLEKAKLLGKETIFTKLTNKAKGLKRAEIAKLGEQLKKYQERKFPGRTDKMRQITDKIDDLKLQIYRSEHLGGTLPGGESVPLKYAPRMYDKYEKATRRWPFFSKFRIRRPYAKHREDIPLQVRKEMGELTGMGYPEVKRAMQVSNDVATADLFNKVAQTPGWVDDAAEGFKKLPDSKAFGILAGRGVHPTVYNQVRATVNVKTNAGKLYDAYAGMWKMGKTIWSSALHFRNMFSNSMLNDITGTDHFKQAQMAKRLVGEIKNQSDDWLTIKRYLVRSGFTEAELMDDLMNISQGGKPSRILDVLTKIPKGFQRASRVPGNIYAKEEMLGKAIKYLHMRELGKTPMEAVKEANRALFDYGALSAWEKTYARRIMPFYTFPRKAIPVVLQSMRDNPYAVAKYPIMFWGMQQHALKKLEITNEDFAELSEQLPEYMQRGSVMLLPYRDENDKLRFFDWTYILPWGPMAEMNQRGPLDVALSNPLYTLAADLQRNKNSFTDRPIYDDSIPWDDMTPDYKRQQNFKKLKYIWQMAMPSLAPEGIYWDKLEQAARGQRPIPETLAHTVFGLRTQPVDTKETEMWHYKGVDKQLKGLSGQLWSLSFKKAKGTITTEEFERQKKIILDQMKHTTQTNLLMKQTR